MYSAMYREFLIESEFKGDKPAPWMSGNKNRNIIRVTNTETDEFIEFDFWGSMEHPVVKTEYDLLNAFQCFVSDAIYADLGFSEFCSTLGYDKYDEEAERVYNECLEHLKMLESIYDGDIYDLSNELSAYA